MSKFFRAMVLVVVLGSCSGGYGSAPRDLDNACSIVNERPEYLRAFKATERKWGVPIPTIMAMIYQESKATDFMGWYMNDTVKETGVALGDTRNQYLAYHDGRTGYLRGTWRRKPWLIRIAGEVSNRAVTYERQLRSCGKI